MPVSSPADPTAPADPFAARLDAFRRQTRVQATSLIMSVFGDIVAPHGARIWLGSLVRLLAPLAVSERLVRTSVFRLAKEGWLRTESLGRRADYALTPAGRLRFEEASRQIYASRAPAWDRHWRLILAVGEFAPKERERLRGALFWQGFGMLDGSSFIHPSADLPTVFDALAAEGLEGLAGRLLPLRAARAQIGTAVDDAGLVARAWNLEGLARAYEDFVATYQDIHAAACGDVRSLPDDETAFLLRLLLMHDYRRLLLRDPELPDVLLPAGWPGQRARQVCRELYRRLWTGSERHLAAHLRLADGSAPPLVKDLPARFA
jgi:phenylacetic acid degradation operon negative regulatory protein